MTTYSRRFQAGIFEARVFATGWAGRVMTALVAAALFVLLLVVASLVAAVVITSAVVIEAKLWWLSRRRLRQASGLGSGTTLEAEYEVVSSDNNCRNQMETATPGDEGNGVVHSGT